MPQLYRIFDGVPNRRGPMGRVPAPGATARRGRGGGAVDATHPTIRRVRRCRTRWALV